MGWAVGKGGKQGVGLGSIELVWVGVWRGANWSGLGRAGTV